MKTHLTTQIFVQSATQAVLAAAVIVSLLSMGFFIAEPRIGHGAESQDIYVRQTITDETSFLVNPSNVTMDTQISGLTGGTATGTNQFVVRSNNSSGYKVTIAFFNNSGAHAMQGDEDDSESIRDYAAGSGTPTPTLVASTAAQFAFSIHSSTTAHTDPLFWSNGTTCNSGAGSMLGRCWKLPSTSAVEIIDYNLPSASGATSTVYFKVHVPSSASPALTAQTYTATATLSVTTQ